jgi:hypothetical protein
VIARAQWAARSGHTSVIDAAGAIYVIGGYDGKYLADVWVSTDGGARPDLVGGVVEGGTRENTTGGSLDYTGLKGYCWGTTGVLRGTTGVLEGVVWGSMGVL